MSDANCYERGKTAIGSSKNWPQTGCPSMDGGTNGMFSSDCSVNPEFCNATMYHFNYCDGASFASHRDAPVVVGKTKVWYRGRDILDASLDSIFHGQQPPAVGSPTQVVVLKGCSAGGLATFLHLDYVAEYFKQRRPTVKVVGLPDAGWFLDHNSTTGAPSYTPLYQWVAQAQNATPSTNAKCVEHHTGTRDAWRCFMAQYTAPFIQTPFFMAQDLVDAFGMSDIFELPCARRNEANCTRAERLLMGQYYDAMWTTIQPLLSNPHRGAFLSARVQHCHINMRTCWNTEVVQGQTIRETFVAWYRQQVFGVVPPLGVSTQVVEAQIDTTPGDCGPV